MVRRYRGRRFFTIYSFYLLSSPECLEYRVWGVGKRDDLREVIRSQAMISGLHLTLYVMAGRGGAAPKVYKRGE